MVGISVGIGRKELEKTAFLTKGDRHSFYVPELEGRLEKEVTKGHFRTHVGGRGMLRPKIYVVILCYFLRCMETWEDERL